MDNTREEKSRLSHRDVEEDCSERVEGRGLSLDMAPRVAADRARWRSFLSPQVLLGTGED